MENQHRQIIGYRDLTEHEIAHMNSARELAIVVGELVESLGNMDGIDQRWVAIAKTDLQKGFMALNRAIAQPTNF